MTSTLISQTSAKLNYPRSLSIVIPAFNEEQYIAETIKNITHVAKDSLDDFEIIVIDDGSTDATVEIVRALADKIDKLRLVIHPVNQGVGSVFHTGLKESNCEYITIIPGDGAYDAESLVEAFSSVGAAKHIGTTRKRRVNYSLGPRTFFSQIFQLFIGFFLQIGVTDPHSVQIYYANALKSLHLHQKGYMYALEALAKLRLQQNDVIEFSVKLKSLAIARSNALQFGVFISIINLLWSLQNIGRIKALIVTGVTFTSIIFCNVGFEMIDTFKTVHLSNGIHTFLYHVLKALTILGIFVTPYCLGILLIGKNQETNIRENKDSIPLIYYFGVGYCALLIIGVLYGGLIILTSTIVLSTIFIILTSALIWRPNLIRAALESFGNMFKPRRSVDFILGIFCMLSVSIFLINVAIPISFQGNDAIQIYYPFLLRVIEDNGFWITQNSLDPSNFLIGRGNGFHMFFALIFEQYIGTIIGGVNVLCGLVSFALITINFSKIFIKNDIINKALMYYFVGVGIWLLYSMHSHEIEKYHSQTFFLLVLLLLALVSQALPKNKVPKQGALIVGCAVSFVIPITFPQYSLFIALFLSSGFISAIFVGKRDFFYSLMLQGLCSVAGFIISISVNYFHVGVFALLPLKIFIPLADLSKFLSWTSIEIWDYLERFQNLNLFSKFLNGLTLHEWVIDVSSQVDLSVFIICGGIFFLLESIRSRHFGNLIGGLIIVLTLTSIALFIVSLFYEFKSVKLVSYNTFSASIIGVYFAMFTFYLDNFKSIVKTGLLNLKPYFAPLLIVLCSLLCLELVLKLYKAPSLIRLLSYFSFKEYFIISLSLTWLHFKFSYQKESISNNNQYLKRHSVNNIFINCAPLFILINSLWFLNILYIYSGGSIHDISIAIKQSYYAFVFNGSFCIFFLYFQFYIKKTLYKPTKWLRFNISRIQSLFILLFALWSLTIYFSIASGSHSLILKRLEYIFGIKSYVEVVNDSKVFSRCTELSSFTETDKRIVALNNLITIVPCHGDTRLPKNKFVHHYNSELGLYFKELMFGPPKSVEAILKKSNIYYFLFFRNFSEKNKIISRRIFGIGFSSIFELSNSLELFDVVADTDEYLMLTWRNSVGTPLSKYQANEIQDAIDQTPSSLNYKQMSPHEYFYN